MLPAYTTHGHAEAPRVRILVPLTKISRTNTSRKCPLLLGRSQLMDMFDECSYRPHQLMYWPTTPSSGKEYVFKHCDSG